MNHVRKCSWASAGSCELLSFVDAEARREEDVCVCVHVVLRERPTNVR